MFHFFKNFKGNPDTLLQIHHEKPFSEDEFKALYAKESFDQIITNFKQFKDTLETNEEIVNTFLWSLWLFDGLEDEAYDQMQYYEKKHNTVRWIRLKGHYVKWKKWYHLALEFYKDTDQEIYDEIDHIFIEYKDLNLEGRYNKVIQFFEKHLYNSISENTLWIGEIYVHALFQTQKHVFDAKLKVDEFLEQYPNHIPYLNLKAEIYSWIGQTYHDRFHIKEAIQIYESLENSDLVKRLRDVSSDYQNEVSDFKKVLTKNVAKGKKSS